MLELPVRILTAAPTGEETLVSVDGVTGARGLNLSHWPGNTTPRELRHDLSTGCALAFSRSTPDRRREWVGAASAFANNHYDTDGCLALLAARHPTRALDRADAMLRAAAAGDFFAWPSDDALAVDAIVTGLNRSSDSPLANELADLSDQARWQRCTDVMLDELPAILDGDLAPWRALWEPVLDDARLDRDDLARCRRADDSVLDLSIWRAPPGARSTRAKGSGRFDPGRHALFGATDADRALVVAPGGSVGEGTCYRFIVSTKSWFDLATEERLPRPDLALVARRLNDLENAAPEDANAWRAQASTNASPELWFGRVGLDDFAEHNTALEPSRLRPGDVQNELERSLR